MEEIKSFFKNKRKVKLSVDILAVTAFLFFGYRVFESSFVSNKRGSRQLTVNVDKVSSRKMNTVLDFIGTATSNESVDITSTITQKVTEINFSDCDFVKKGDVLVRLNMKKQKAMQKQAEINLKEQERELARLESLKNKKIVAEKDYDIQNTKFLDAQAKLDEINEEIREGTITAPFDGVLGIRKISVGTLLTPGTVITTIDDIKHIKVDFPVPEKYFKLIDTDCKISATSIAIPGKKFKGRVKAISPRISPISRSINVRGIIDNSEYLLRPGMMLNVFIELQERETLMVPENSISNIGEKHFVFLPDEKNKVKQTVVEIGQRENGFVEIINGLKKGDTIVTDGVVKLSDGDTVKIIDATSGDS